MLVPALRRSGAEPTIRGGIWLAIFRELVEGLRIVSQLSKRLWILGSEHHPEGAEDGPMGVGHG